MIENAASANLNNVSTSKQSVNSTTGLVVIASVGATKTADPDKGDAA